MIDFDDKGDLVGILSSDDAQHAIRRGNGITAALNSQLHDILRVEVERVSGKRGARGMLNALIHRQDRQITSTAEPARIEKLSHTSQHLRRAIRGNKNLIKEVRPRQMQSFLGDPGLIGQKIPAVAERLFDDVNGTSASRKSKSHGEHFLSE